MMDETEFTTLSSAVLNRIETALDECGADVDYEVQPGGVLELEFEDGSKIIVNRHSVAQEIWVAAKSGGFHYKYDGQKWLGTRDGEELFQALSRLASLQSGEDVVLKA